MGNMNSRQSSSEDTLSSGIPWDRRIYGDSTPSEWERDPESGKWKPPPNNWRFDGRYWILVPECKSFLNGECKDGQKCRKIHLTTEIKEEVLVDEQTETVEEVCNDQNRREDSLATESSHINSSSVKSLSVKSSSVESSSVESLSVESFEKVEDEPVKFLQSDGNEEERIPHIDPFEAMEDELVDFLRADREEPVEIPCMTSAQAVGALVSLIGFKAIADHVAALEKEMEIMRIQGRELQNVSGRMNLVMVTEAEFDFDRAARIYHGYCKASRFIPKECDYVKLTGSSDILDGVKKFKSGTLLITNAQQLDEAKWIQLSLVLKRTPEIVVVLIIQEREVSASLRKIISSFPPPVYLRVCTNVNYARIVLDSIAESMAKTFKGRMKVEAGIKGPYVQLCARKILEKCDKGEKQIRETVNVEMEKIYDRQLNRLKWKDSVEAGKLDAVDPLFLTAEDLLGPLPDTSRCDIKEWVELQSMIGLEEVKQSVRAVLDTVLANYYRELNGQKPLKVRLSRLFLGPPGTGEA
jgi:hypothetical protein